MELENVTVDTTDDYGAGEEVQDTSQLTQADDDNFLDGLEFGDEVTEEDYADTELTDEVADEPTEETDEPVPPVPQAPPEAPVYKVKHLGQEIELTQEQLIINAQKGLDYDRIRTDRDTIKNSKQLKLIQDLAKESGYDNVDEFVDEFYNNLEQSKIQNRADQLVMERGIDFEVAVEMAEMEIENERLKTVQVKPVTYEAPVNPMVSGFEELFKKHPEIKTQYAGYDDLPMEFRAKISQGDDPVNAWTQYIIDTKDKQLQEAHQALIALQNNNKNRQKATQSVKDSSYKKETDDFLKGLFG